MEVADHHLETPAPAENVVVGVGHHGLLGGARLSSGLK
jgi:hypothetical protein